MASKEVANDAGSLKIPYRYISLDGDCSLKFKQKEIIQVKNNKDEKKHVPEKKKFQGDEVIRLDVGGWKYSTTLNTLRAEQGSMLEKMFSGYFAIKKEKDGTVFIDRNGELFNYVLDYLRGNMASIDDLLFEENTRKRLIKEANYFQLEGMKNLLSYKTNSVEVKGDCKKEIAEIIEKVIDNKEAINNALHKSVVVEKDIYKKLHLTSSDLKLSRLNYADVTTEPIFFANKNFDDVDFSDITFKHDTTFLNCRFYKTMFNGCYFESGVCAFRECELFETTFSRTSVDDRAKLKFDGSDIKYSDFTGLNDLFKNVCLGNISFFNVKNYDLAIIEKKKISESASQDSELSFWN